MRMRKGLWMTLALAALAGGGAVAVLVVHVTSSRGPLGDLKWSDAAPNWSPAGKKIAFASNRGDPSRPFDAIYVMNADGSGVQKVTKDTDAEMPRWSPDGTRLAYVADLFQIDQYDQKIYSGVDSINVVQADGSGEEAVAASGYTNDVQWSPDGRWIAFQTSNGVGAISLEIVRPNGHELRRVARDASTFAWSSDGRRLFFTRSSYGGGTTIYAVWLPSGKTIRVANFNGDSVDAIASSPDGSWIAFIGGRISNDGSSLEGRAYLVHADGRKEHAVGFLGGTASNGLAWLPRPAHALLYYSEGGIYFASTIRRGARLINADGCCAAPSPDGKKLLFVEYDSSGHKSAIFLASLNGHSFRRLTQLSR